MANEIVVVKSTGELGEIISTRYDLMLRYVVLDMNFQTCTGRCKVYRDDELEVIGDL